MATEGNSDGIFERWSAQTPSPTGRTMDPDFLKPQSDAFLQNCTAPDIDLSYFHIFSPVSEVSRYHLWACANVEFCGSRYVHGGAPRFLVSEVGSKNCSLFSQILLPAGQSRPGTLANQNRLDFWMFLPNMYRFIGVHPSPYIDRLESSSSSSFQTAQPEGSTCKQDQKRTQESCSNEDFPDSGSSLFNCCSKTFQTIGNLNAGGLGSDSSNALLFFPLTYPFKKPIFMDFPGFSHVFPAYCPLWSHWNAHW